MMMNIVPASAADEQSVGVMFVPPPAEAPSVAL